MFKTEFENLRRTCPLIHNITNYVTVNDCANMVLACGASPIMADDAAEVEDITTICGGLNINIGTLNSRTIESMLKAGKKANALGHPVVLDPVGAGASQLRTDTANRLLRRIVRDYKYRGYSARDTIKRWPSVRAGEAKWIFPYQENADVMFNSSLFYEISVLRPVAEPILREIPDTVPEYGEAARLLKFLDNFTPIKTDEIPPTSILREFIGGSSFKY